MVATLDGSGYTHTSCKGIVDIDKNGRIYLLDLYKGKTFRNLKHNPKVSITAFDEHKFIGYCLKGTASIAESDTLEPRIYGLWENKITNRLTARLIRNIRGEKGHHRHPEVLLPKPKYLIVMEVKKVVDLTPRHINI